LSPYAMLPRKALRPSHLGGASTQVTVQEKGGTIVPLERITIPVADLNGSHGENRAISRRNRLQSDDDLAAINAWLTLYREHSERAYRKEAERLWPDPIGWSGFN